MPDNYSTDILVFAAHPDDAELGCAGTVYQAIQQGKTCVFVDLTQGEMGTRGTAETRAQESADAARILGLMERVNLGLPDGHLFDTDEYRIKLIEAIRHYRPEIVICNSRADRHPDHGNGHMLAESACFLAGVGKIETRYKGEAQAPTRPRLALNYIQDRWIQPDIVVDITDSIDKKIEAVSAFKTQFYDPNSKEPATYISSPEFFEGIKARAREYGKMINRPFAEGFTSSKQLGVRDIFHLI